MDNNMISRAEHEEFVRRMDEANSRQDKRLDAVENKTGEIYALAANMQKLATSMEAMMEEQKKTSERLETLEGRDGAMWRKVVGYILTALATAVMTLLFSRFYH